MSYEYIRNYYGIDVPVGSWVQHTVTGRFGTVRPEGGSNLHYVLVQFAGDNFATNCHPRELEFEDAILPYQPAAKGRFERRLRKAGAV